ncbi:uncharacterized protein LOC128721200 [Anopheles nili]|uniref:uncharacterized protein LOC128721200 n=1 Tax=Anopheles nili TaxID=185578 RepID=UPI00237A6118|nr:uncharacterized protein LOC128721200 [Anopheles nili]
MRLKDIVTWVHNIFGGPIIADDRSSHSCQRCIYTMILITISCGSFILCMFDIRNMLYPQDLVLSVIDLLTLIGIAFTVFTIYVSSLTKFFHKPKAHILQCLNDLDAVLYTVNMHEDPSQILPMHCAFSIGCTVFVAVALVLVDVFRSNNFNAMVSAFKVHGLFVIFLTHGLFLVISYHIWKRMRYMGLHLEKMIEIANRRKEQPTKNWENSNIRFCRGIKSLAIAQIHCFETVNCLNDEYGLQNVTVFGIFFFILTAKSFHLFYVCSVQFKQKGLTIIDTLEPGLMIVVVFFYFFATTYVGEMVIREAQLVLNNLHKIESIQPSGHRKTNYSLDIESELVEQFGNQILHQPISFTVMNFFQVDLKFFHLVMASIATYLIILLQFDFQN